MKSHQQVRLTVFALIGYILPSLVFAQADNITTSGNWNNTGIWSTSSLPTSTSTVGWPATATTVYFPQSSQLGSAFMVTIASMTMANNSTLNLGDGGSYSSGDTLIISGDLIDGNNSVINIKSNGILKVLGNLKVNNGLQLNVDAGGVLIVNGTVDIKNNTALELAGTVTIGSNLNLGNNGQITVPLGGVVTVNGSVSAGSNTCANVAGTFTVSGGCSGGGTNCGSGGNQSFCSALPITLSSFVGAQKDQSVELKWSTSSEINFDHFVLERSSNGKTFSELQQIKGSGFSNTRKNYSYTDNYPLIGNSYYRLTSVDFDGYTEIFNNNVVRVRVSAGKNFFIAPNPIDHFNLRAGTNFDSSNGQLIIYDRLGSVIGRYSASGSSFEFQLPNLPNGVYFAQFHSEEFTKSVRFSVND